jgi:hypothetical protein
VKSWAEISTDPDFINASPEVQSEVRRRFLENAFSANPQLAKEDKEDITSEVMGPPSSAELPSGTHTGFLGQTVGKAGRLALEVTDFPFIPLHWATEKAKLGVEYLAPATKRPFAYHKASEERIKTLLKRERPEATEEQIAAFRQFGGLPQTDPRLYYERKEAGTLSDWIVGGAEIAATGGYVKYGLGTFARLGSAVAARYIRNGLEALKILEKWTEKKVLLERAGRFLHSGVKGAEAKGSVVYGEWMDKVPEAADRVRLFDLVEQGFEKIAEFAKRGDPIAEHWYQTNWNSLKPNQQEALTWYIGRDQERKMLAKQFGILRSPLESYVPHIKEEIEAAKSGVLFQLHRHHKLSVAELEALGKNPFSHDIAAVDALHEVAFQRTLVKKQFSDMTRLLRATDGRPAIVTKREFEREAAMAAQAGTAHKYTDYIKANPKYTRIQDQLGIIEAAPVESVTPALESGLRFRPTDIYMHPEFEKQFRRLLPPIPGETPSLETLKNLIHGSRRLIMMNPLVHGVNISSTVAAAAPWGNAAKVVGFFTEGASLKKAALRGDTDAAGLLLEAVHNGANIPAISSEWRRLSHDLMGRLPTDKPGVIGGLVEKLPGGKKVTGFFSNLAEESDRFLWDSIVSNPMLSMYKHVRDKWAPLIGESEAGRVAAEFVNTNQGTLAIESFSPVMQKAGQWFMFSRSWTMSNYRSFFQALGIPVAAKHLTPAGQAALAQEWMEVWARSMAYYMIGTELANRAIAGHSAGDNPPGHELDIDTGRYDKQGRRIYAAGSAFLYVRQQARLMGHVAKQDIAGVSADLYGKLGVWKAAFVEVPANKEIFSGRPVYLPGDPTLLKINKMLTHAVAGATPFGQTLRETSKPGAESGETVRELITDPLTWTRILTYWPSHGLTYHTEVFTRLKRADKFLVMNNMSPEARSGLIRGIAFGRIEGVAATELKDLKDRIASIREIARDKALHEVIRGNPQEAARILTRAGWTVEGAKTFIQTRGRKVGRLMGEPAEGPTPSQARGENPLAEFTGKRTKEGRPIFRNKDGSFSTERTVTVEINGRWINVPTIFGGRELPAEQAIERLRQLGFVDPETGNALPTFSSKSEAIEAAKARSKSLGEELRRLGLTEGD